MFKITEHRYSQSNKSKNRVLQKLSAQEKIKFHQLHESLIKFQDFLNIELKKLIPEKNPSVKNKRNWIDNEIKKMLLKNQIRQLYLKEEFSSANEKYEN